VRGRDAEQGVTAPRSIELRVRYSVLYSIALRPLYNPREIAYFGVASANFEGDDCSSCGGRSQLTLRGAIRGCTSSWGHDENHAPKSSAPVCKCRRSAPNFLRLDKGARLANAAGNDGGYLRGRVCSRCVGTNSRLHLSDFLGQQVIIENVGGAGGMTGAARVAKAAPDGYQFVVGGTGTFAANQTLYKKPLYNAAADFAPVVLIDEQPIVLVARKDFPASNLGEFIAYSKAKEAKLQFGSAGIGSGSHLACVVFNATVGINVAHGPYRAAVLAIQDLVAGRIDYLCPLISAAYPQVESDGIKALAIFARDRSPILPNLGSADEQGMANFEVYYWDAFFFPKGTPAPIVDKLHDATVAAMNTPFVQERLKSLGATFVAPERRAPEYLQKYVESEIEKWARVIKASGAILD
jgi:tripartite-type tricarboxylate transporter receptor subunit TctC